MADSTSYPVDATVLLLMIAGFLYCLIRYRNYRVRNLYLFRDIWVKLILYFGMISTLLFLVDRTIKEFQIFMFAERIVNILSIISFILFLAFIIKAGLPKVLRNQFLRKLLLACGILILICIIVVVVSINKIP